MAMRRLGQVNAAGRSYLAPVKAESPPAVVVDAIPLDEDKLHADDSILDKFSAIPDVVRRPFRMAQIISLNHSILQVPSFGGAMVSISTLGSGTVPSAS